MKSPDRSRKAAASLIVALAKGTPPKKARASAAVARTGTAKISDKYEKRFASLMASTDRDVVEFLQIVLQNNPTKTVTEIIKRPDVAQALRAHEASLEPAKALLAQGWDESVQDAQKKARGEVELISGQWEGFDEDRSVLDRLTKDLDKNSKAHRARLIAAMRLQHRAELPKNQPSPVEKVERDRLLRNQYTMQHGVWSAARMVRESAFARGGVNRRWIAAFGPNMCSHCRRLHNLVAGPGEQFPHHFTGLRPLSVYMGVLWGPPRHPNCQCVVVPTRAKSNLWKFVA